jgi:hypothetical protein
VAPPLAPPSPTGDTSSKWRKDPADVPLGAHAWLTPSSARTSTSGQSVLADGYENGPRRRPYKLKLAPSLADLTREKEALDRVHRVGLGRAQALVVECIDLEGPVSHPAILDGTACHALVLEAGQLDLREALQPHIYSKCSRTGPHEVCSLVCVNPVLVRRRALQQRHGHRGPAPDHRYPGGRSGDPPGRLGVAGRQARGERAGSRSLSPRG